ncbi:MAG TPA: PDZ domain-containing protein [Elusimicrobiota bacterium]|jgi:hypothetical protein|nr:PDZ domain-containing protein [Elusimicrobiota bacterium]
MASERVPAAILACLAAAACAGPRPAPRVGYLGTGLCPAADGLSVLLVASGSPAERAGLREGDVLVEYRGLPLSRVENRRRLLWDMRSGDGKPLRLAALRGAKRVSLKASPAWRPSEPKDDLYAPLMDALMAGRNVSVAVVVSDVRHASPQFFKSAQALEAWKQGMREHAAGLFEGILLNRAFVRCPAYTVADRQRTEEVLKELHLQMSGAVSPETSRDVGKLTGASHLLFVSVTRFPRTSGGYEDDFQARLVAVESDAVLASVRLRRAAQAQ